MNYYECYLEQVDNKINPEYGPARADYFRYLVPYQRHTRVPDNFIYVYSFAIKPEDNQPSGSCNFSRLNTSEFIMNFKKGIDNLTTRIYAINYNLLNIHNGMGGLAYSN